MIDVIPAILPESFEDLENQVSRVHKLVKRVQIDVVDGLFAPSRTWPFNGADTDVFEKLVHEEEGLPFWKEVDYEIDMMVKNPKKKALDFVQAGAKAIIIHHGSTGEFTAIADELRNLDVEIGLAVKPSTLKDEYVQLLSQVTFLQVMGNDKIGYHGVELDERVYDTIKNIRKEFPNLPIGVDIGVNEDTAEKLVEAGATRLAIGSALFDSGDIRENIHFFQNL